MVDMLNIFFNLLLYINSFVGIFFCLTLTEEFLVNLGAYCFLLIGVDR